MQRVSHGDLVYLTFDLLADCPRVAHGTFLRHGGVSEGPFATLNFGITQGDDPLHVAENVRRALTALNLTCYASSYQVHGRHVAEVATSGTTASCDGMMTRVSNLALLVQHADCQASLFYDPIHHALATIHCGWRGSVQNIYQETVDKMRALYSSNPADILVCISPSLGPDAAEFINFQKELPEHFWPFQIRPTYFDFWEISRWQLSQAGILPHHIEIAGICTYKETEDCFSYRRLKRSGRHATIGALL